METVAISTAEGQQRASSKQESRTFLGGEGGGIHALVQNLDGKLDGLSKLHVILVFLNIFVSTQFAVSDFFTCFKIDCAA